MAIRGDSYSSVDQVLALTRHLLNTSAYTTFNSTTRPTVTEIETFIDQGSGSLNIALRDSGYSPANVKANSTAKLTCDAWVRNKAVAMAHLTQPYQGWQGDDDNPARFISEAAGNPYDFIEDSARGFELEGITRDVKVSDGLTFTAETAQKDRSDPDDTSLQQPKFEGGMFDNPRAQDRGDYN